jgi:hypothetical protein
LLPDEIERLIDRIVRYEFVNKVTKETLMDSRGIKLSESELKEKVKICAYLNDLSENLIEIIEVR